MLTDDQLELVGARITDRSPDEEIGEVEVRGINWDGTTGTLDIRLDEHKTEPKTMQQPSCGHKIVKMIVMNLLGDGDGEIDQGVSEVIDTSDLLVTFGGKL